MYNSVDGHARHKIAYLEIFSQKVFCNILTNNMKYFLLDKIIINFTLFRIPTCIIQCSRRRCCRSSNFTKFSAYNLENQTCDYIIMELKFGVICETNDNQLNSIL